MTPRVSVRLNLLCYTISLFAVFSLAGCGSGSSSGTTSSNPSSSVSLLSNQTTVANIAGANGSTCNLVTRDTSSCQSARTALGLSGNWLAFSCTVQLGLATSTKTSTTNYASAAYVTVTTQSLPDHKSNYYPTTGSYSFTANGIHYGGNYSDLHINYNPPFPDPNTISQRTETFYIPISPTFSGTSVMQGGPIGVAIDGTNLYSALAASTDNIFAEDESFDGCHGHPDGNSRFHYHAEPHSISYDDNHLIGVMRDGFFVYGRRDYDSTTPGTIAAQEAAGATSKIYKYGGHVGPDPLTGAGSLFHYHLTEWMGCYNESGGVKARDDGETNDTLNSGLTPNCGGTWEDDWFISGHGNGGAFMTVPSNLYGQSPSQSVPGVRYYYGTPGTCSGC